MAKNLEPELLVTSLDSFEVLNYDNETGDFLGTFASGLPSDRPVSMTYGPDGDLYVGVNNFEPSFVSSILRFDGHTGEFMGKFASDGGLVGPSDLAFGSDGNLYVSSFGGMHLTAKLSAMTGLLAISSTILFL